jgi:hypothetical protein
METTEARTPQPADVGPVPEPEPIPKDDPGPDPSTPDPEYPGVDADSLLADQIVVLNDRLDHLIRQLQSQGILPRSYLEE